MARSAAAPMPYLSIVPGAKFSKTTSTLGTILCRSAWPSDDLMLRVTLRLLVFRKLNG